MVCRLFPLIAQVDSLSWVGPLIQLASSGGFAGLAWYFVMYRMPEMEQRFISERKEWMGYMQRRDERFEAILERCIKCIEESNGHARRA